MSIKTILLIVLDIVFLTWFVYINKNFILFGAALLLLFFIPLMGFFGLKQERRRAWYEIFQKRIPGILRVVMVVITLAFTYLYTADIYTFEKNVFYRSGDGGFSGTLVWFYSLFAAVLTFLSALSIVVQICKDRR